MSSIHGRRIRTDRRSSYARKWFFNPFCGGGTVVKKLLALVVALVFAAGSAGVALAQTPTPDTKADKPGAMKKTPLRNANGTVKAASADSIVVAGKARKDRKSTRLNSSHRCISYA